VFNLPERLLLAAVNHLLGQAPWARRSARPLVGQTIRLNVPGAQLNWAFDTEGWMCAVQTEPLAQIDLPFLLLLRLATGDARARYDIPLQGDAQLANQFALVLGQLSWDAEADLARFVGDAPAHFISQAAHQLTLWKINQPFNLTHAWVEFATEESALLVQRHQLTTWVEEVNTLRDTCARLDKRLDYLMRQRNLTAPQAETIQSHSTQAESTT
jgi:ubiquinone biosynthesis protein UbiJ